MYCIPTMAHNMFHIIRKPHLRTVFFWPSLRRRFLPLHSVWATGDIPLPGIKPAQLSQISQNQADIPDSGAPQQDNALAPVPKPRPAFFYDGGLSREDIARYRSIFALQAQGKMEQADQEIAKLGDLRLRGHVLHQRYLHPTAYSSSLEELQNWMVFICGPSRRGSHLQIIMAQAARQSEQ